MKKEEIMRLAQGLRKDPERTKIRDAITAYVFLWKTFRDADIPNLGPAQAAFEHYNSFRASGKSFDFKFKIRCTPSSVSIKKGAIIHGHYLNARDVQNLDRWWKK